MSDTITVTEALAEIKTIDKRIEKKRDFIGQYLARQDAIRDPLAKDVDGGSPVAIKRELQAVDDLEARALELRRRIRLANESTMVSVEGKTLSIADWLTWRRDVLPTRKTFLNALRSGLTKVHNAAKQNGAPIRASGDEAKAPTDFIVNIDEMALAKQIEDLETISGSLDGILSLKNATVAI